MELYKQVIFKTISQSFNRSFYYISIFILLFTFPAALNAQNVMNGKISINQSAFKNKKNIRLDGNWEFYWDKIYSPEDFRNKRNTGLSGFFNVPMYWTSYKNMSLPSEGKATYRVIINNCCKGKTFSITLPEIYSKYRLFINGKLIDSHGTFINKETRFLKPQTFTFYNSHESIEIILNIKNHHHNNAGIGQSIYIGHPESIERKDLFDRITEIILVAICIFAGIYHLILFSFRMEEKELLYFGLFSIVIAFRTILTGTSFIMQIFPELPFGIGSRSATIVIPLSVMTFQLYVYYFFKERMPLKPHKFLMALHLIYGLLIFSTPTLLYTTLYTEYLFVIITSVLLILLTSVISLKHKAEYAGIFIGGFVFIILGVVNDMLHYLQIINTGYYMSLFFAFFIIAQSVMLAIKFSREHILVENLSQRLQVMDKLKDEFLANTSHELKTPLNGIIGISDSLIEGTAGPITEKVHYNLNLISSSGRRLASLINDILDYSKLKNNDILLSEKNIDLRQMVSVVLTIIKSTTSRENIELKNSISSELPCVVGDENRLQQILFNLIGNAVKFTENGSVRVFATEEDSYIKIHVEDTGTGISHENIEKIFLSFEQADGSISRVFGGTGLGLSITKQLVELQGGTIGVNSEPGKGSLFYFTMKKASGNESGCTEVMKPILINATEQQADFLNPIPHTQPERKKILDEKILIVDDETVNIHVLENYLYLEGYKTKSATNGQDAIELVKNESFDLILLDIMMPKMSGFEVCTLLRKEYTSYELPILMLTARNISSDIATAFHSGANDYLVKPIDRHELIARIKTQISLSYAVDDAIRNAQLANTDELSGMFNRRFLMQAGKRELRNSINNNKTLSVVMLDIDKFKSINDTYGHSAGDMVIKEIANVITKSIRGVDIAARYGGEEFIILLPATDMDGAKIASEKIRQAIEESQVIHENKIIKFTSSFGISTLDEKTCSFDILLESADKMLYISKKEGRNRITAAE